MIITPKGYTLILNTADLEEIFEFAWNAGYNPTDSELFESENYVDFLDTWLDGTLKITNSSISEGAVFININISK